jgi:hypothetical protein
MTTTRDWMDVSSPSKAPLSLYLVEVLTYGTKHPIKIGVTKDLAKRMRNLPSMGISCPKLLGHFAFASASEARKVEAETRKAFPRDKDYGEVSREILDAPADAIRAFVAARAPGAFIPANKSLMQ